MIYIGAVLGVLLAMLWKRLTDNYFYTNILTFTAYISMSLVVLTLINYLLKGAN